MRFAIAALVILLSGCITPTTFLQEVPQETTALLEAPLSAGDHFGTPIALTIPEGTWQGFRLVTDDAFWNHNAGANVTSITVATNVYGEPSSALFGIRWAPDHIAWLPWSGANSGVNLLWTQEEIAARPEIEVLVAIASPAQETTAYVAVGEPNQSELVAVAPEINGTYAVAGSAARWISSGSVASFSDGEIQFDESWRESSQGPHGSTMTGRVSNVAGTSTSAPDSWTFLRLFNMDSAGVEAWQLDLVADGESTSYASPTVSPLGPTTTATMHPHMDLAFESPAGDAGFHLERTFSGWYEDGPAGAESAFFVATWGRFDIDPTPLGWDLEARLPGVDPLPTRMLPVPPSQAL